MADPQPPLPPTSPAAPWSAGEPILEPRRMALYDCCELYPAEGGFRTHLCATGFDPSSLSRTWRQFASLERKTEEHVAPVVAGGGCLSPPRTFQCRKVQLALQPLVRGGLDAKCARADVHAIRGACGVRVQVGIGTHVECPGALLPMVCDFHIPTQTFFAGKLQLNTLPELHYAWRLYLYLHGDVNFEVC